MNYKHARYNHRRVSRAEFPALLREYLQATGQEATKAQVRSLEGQALRRGELSLHGGLRLVKDGSWLLLTPVSLSPSTSVGNAPPVQFK